MPEATKDIHDSKAPAGDLDVSDMLADLAIDAPVAPAPAPVSGNGAHPAPPHPAPPAPPKTAHAPPAPPGPTAATPAGPAEDALLNQVNALLEHPAPPAPAEQDAPALDLTPEAQSPGPAAAAPAAPAEAAPTIPAKKIESLDAELATIADELISVEFKDEPAPLSENELADVAAAGPAPASATPPPASAPIPGPPKPAPKPAEPEPAKAAPAGPRWKRTLASILGPASKSLLPLAAALSRPLAKRPAHIRDIVGWNALWVGFLALCLWGYVLFLRSPEPPVPSLEPARTHQAAKSEVSHEKKPADKKSAEKKPAAKPTKEASAAKH